MNEFNKKLEKMQSVINPRKPHLNRFYSQQVPFEDQITKEMNNIFEIETNNVNSIEEIETKLENILLYLPEENYNKSL